MDHFYETIEGWFNFSDVYQMAVDRYPSGAHFVEVGVWKGRSASFMAVEIINSNKNIRFDCVDNFMGSNEEAHIIDPDIQNGKLRETFITNMKPVEGHYNIVEMNSVDAAKTYQDTSLDFVFLDASHEIEAVMNDIKAWYPKIKIGGTLAGDDYHWDTVSRAVNELLINKTLMTNDYSWLITKRDINLC